MSTNYVSSILQPLTLFSRLQQRQEDFNREKISGTGTGIAVSVNIRPRLHPYSHLEKPDAAAAVLLSAPVIAGNNVSRCVAPPFSTCSGRSLLSSRFPSTAATTKRESPPPNRSRLPPLRRRCYSAGDDSSEIFCCGKEASEQVQTLAPPLP
ncbi:hypothetical protein L1887_01745 [Cichorium endivia]|nr:hypothetical protein L1887_01745 [Cichorium endivia]